MCYGAETAVQHKIDFSKRLWNFAVVFFICMAIVVLAVKTQSTACSSIS